MELREGFGGRLRLWAVPVVTVPQPTRLHERLLQIN
jgi:hypothetical protein